MIYFEQLRDPERGCLSYLLGDLESGEAVVVDALEPIGVEGYVLRAAERGLALRSVIDTHLHADHRSIGPALAEAAGCPYQLRDGAATSLPYTPLVPGQVLRLGALSLEVLATPGHTPESLSLLGRDRERQDQPWFVLSGDSLMVGDVGRPDLLLGEGGEVVAERAITLYHTLHDTLLALPDWVELYPAHYGASSCGGRHMSGKTGSTIGFERRYNVALLAPDQAAFVQFVLATLKEQPAGYQEIKRRNMGEVRERA